MDAAVVEEQLVTAALDETFLSDVLLKGLDRLASTLPAECHAWENYRLDRAEGRVGIVPSTRILAVDREVNVGRWVTDLVPAFETELASHAGWRRIQDESNANWAHLQPRHLLVHAMSRYLHVSPGLRFDADAASRVARGFLRSLETGSFILDFVAPVFGVLVDADEVCICEDVTLRRATADELVHMAVGFDGTIDRKQLSCVGEPNQSVLCQRVHERIARPSATVGQGVGEAFMRVRTALRLALGRRVELGRGFSNDVNPGQLLPIGVHHAEMRGIGAVDPSSAITLTIESTDLARRIGKRLRSVPRKLALAIDRVERAFDRGDPDDVLIDAAIAIDLTVGGDRGASIPARAAFLLEELPEARGVLYAVVDRGLEARNKIVHGSDGATSSTSERQHLADELWQVARRVVVRLIEEEAITNKVPTGKDIDRRMLGIPTPTRRA